MFPPAFFDFPAERTVAMRFTKMQGLGNDYLYLYGPPPEDAAALARRLSDRHFGPGADGVIYIFPSRAADFAMRVFNADGSEAAMCGNGIRCVGKYVFDRGLTAKTRLSIETPSGVRWLEMRVDDGAVRSVSVEMGRFEVGPDKELWISGERVLCTPVSVGNPHAVLFVPDADAAPVTRLGPAIERHSAFPGGVNVEFAQALSPTEMRVRVWERGSGLTLACGTGACACVAAAASRGLSPFGESVNVRLDGGVLSVTVRADGTISMTGPAETVYEGEITI